MSEKSRTIDWPPNKHRYVLNFADLFIIFILGSDEDLLNDLKVKTRFLNFPVGCRFPFLYRGLWHEKCTKLHPADSESFKISQIDNGLR